MNKYLIVTVIFFGLILNVNGQNMVDVTETTIKVAGLGEEVFYYGFAEGDQMIFSFEEANGKELKELEIKELPSSSKFMDYKTNKIENKTLNINRTAIYQFRFSNSALSGRICKIKIQRKPFTELTKNFNTSVYWRTLYDTTYVPRQEKYLVKSDTTAQTIVDQTSRIASSNALNGSSNKTIVDFQLPQGTTSWSYYIGVGNEGKKAYNDAKENFLNSAASTASTIPGYGTMAALALYGVNAFNKVQGEDNVKYWFISNWENVQLFNSGQTFLQYKQGNVVNDASQMKAPLAGKVFLGMYNDNIMDPIDVVVKVTAIVVKQEWGMRTIQDVKITKREEAYLKN